MTQITIKMNAAHNDVIVDGRVFDRSKMTKPQNKQLTRMVVAGLKKDGRFAA